MIFLLDFDLFPGAFTVGGSHPLFRWILSPRWLARPLPRRADGREEKGVLVVALGDFCLRKECSDKMQMT